MTWGKIIHPEAIRPQIWLKASVFPDYFTLLEAESLLFGGGKPVRVATPEIHIPTARILGYHMLPPTEFVPDYDESEPNREMRQVTLDADIFRFEGVIRIASFAGLKGSIQSFKEPYRPVYAALVSCPIAPEIKPLSIPYALVRTDEILYTSA